MQENSFKTSNTIVHHKFPGCFGLIIFIISICFLCTFIKNCCNSWSPWEAAVQTTHDYYVTADSIWNND